MADSIDKSVLSPFSASDFGRAQMLTQIQNFYTKKAEQKTASITNRFTASINSINMENDRWRAVREGIQAGRSILSDNLARAKSILASLNNMISAVNKAGQNAEGYTNALGYAATFDSYLRSLDYAASNSTTKPNLLGVAKQELNFRVGIHGATQTTNSAYLGSDYYIIDSEGKYWDLDRSAQILKRYDVYPDDPMSNAANLATGLRLDDLTGDAITFTVGPDTATPETFSGTLYRTGLDILDSWGYEGLATEAGRQQALDDLNSAKVAVDIEVRRYTLAFTTADYYEKVASEAISGLVKKTNQLTIDQAIEIQKEQAALSQEYQTSTNSIVQAIAAQNQYGRMLGAALSNKFGKSLVNILT
jgi:hypothetical protein